MNWREYITLAVTAAVALLAVEPVRGMPADSPWPMFQHDLKHTGRSPFVGPQDNNVKCTFPLNGGAVGSPAIGTDGTIYIPSGQLSLGGDVGFLYAVNPDCTQKWVYQLPGPPASTAPTLAADGTIYVHANGGEGNIVAIERLTAISPEGSLKWQFEFNDGAGNFASHVQSSPAVALDGTIYVGSLDTRLYAINPDGKLKWRRTITVSSISSSPVIAPTGTIYIVDPFDLAAFSPDGTLLWQRQLANSSASSDASPSIAADGTIYIGEGEELQAINPDGTPKWKFPTSGVNPINSTPAIGADGTIYVGADGLYALNPNGTFKWKFPDTTVLFSSASPVIGADGTIYWRESFTAYAVNPNGTEKWSMDVDPGSSAGLDPSGAIATDGVLYMGDGGFTKPVVLLAIFTPPPPPPPEAEPATPQTPIRCTGSGCRAPVICNLPEDQGAPCTNRIDLLAFVRRGSGRLIDDTEAKAPRRIRFAFGISNVPPGEIKNVRLRLTSTGRRIVKMGKTRLRGVIEIRNTPGDLIDRTPVRIRIR